MWAIPKKLIALYWKVETAVFPGFLAATATPMAASAALATTATTGALRSTVRTTRGSTTSTAATASCTGSTIAGRSGSRVVASRTRLFFNLTLWNIASYSTGLTILDFFSKKAKGDLSLSLRPGCAAWRHRLTLAGGQPQPGWEKLGIPFSLKPCPPGRSV